MSAGIKNRPIASLLQKDPIPVHYSHSSDDDDIHPALKIRRIKSRRESKRHTYRSHSAISSLPQYHGDVLRSTSSSHGRLYPTDFVECARLASALVGAHDKDARNLLDACLRKSGSLPELLHHAGDIVDLWISYVDLRTEGGGVSSDVGGGRTVSTSHDGMMHSDDGRFFALHLLMALSETTRHEMLGQEGSREVEVKLRRILKAVAGCVDQNDVPLSTAAVRTAGLLVRNSRRVLRRRRVRSTENEISKSNGDGDLLTTLSELYDPWLGHARDWIRRLAGEAIGGACRAFYKKDPQGYGEHLRVLLEGSNTESSSIAVEDRRVDGIGAWMFQTWRGGGGGARAHLRAPAFLRAAWNLRQRLSPGDVRLLDRSLKAAWDRLLAFPLSKQGINSVNGAMFEMEDVCFGGVLQVFRNGGHILHDGNILATIMTTVVEKSWLCNCYLQHRTAQMDACENNFLHIVRLALQQRSPSWATCSSFLNMVVASVRYGWKSVSGTISTSTASASYRASLEEMLCSSLRSDDNATRNAIRDQFIYLVPREVCTDVLVPEILSLLVASDGYENIPTTLWTWIQALERLTVVKDDEEKGAGPIVAVGKFDIRTLLPQVEIAQDIKISLDVRDSLMDACLHNITASLTSSGKIKTAVAAVDAAKSLSFLLLLNIMEGDNDGNKDNNSDALKKAMSVASILSGILEKNSMSSDEGVEHLITILLESAASLLTSRALFSLHAGLKMKMAQKRLLRSMRKHLSPSLLARYPARLQACAALCSACSSTISSLSVSYVFLPLRQCSRQGKKNKKLADISPATTDIIAALEEMAPLLSNPNFLTRCCAVTVLATLPHLLYTVDHASLDCADDLDDGEGTVKNMFSPPSQNRIGECVVLPTLCDVLCTASPTVAMERVLISRLHGLRAMMCSEGVPPVYRYLVACACVGIFYFRFSPLWEPAAAVLGSIGGDAAWEAMEPTLRRVLMGSNDASVGGSRGFVDDNTLFITLFEKVLGPELSTLIVTQGQDFIPLVLRYLWYRIRRDDGGDSISHAEVGLGAAISALPPDEAWTQCASLSAAIRPPRHHLPVLLNCLAKIRGPTQLPHNPVLLRLYVELLSNPSHAIARPALDCVLSFRLPYLSPYSEVLVTLLGKSWRETLTKFDLGMGGDVDATHRSKFLPMLSRILFGRFLSAASSASGSKASSERQNRGARALRVAVLAFLGNYFSGEELSTWMYLMVRPIVGDPCQDKGSNGMEVILPNQVSSWTLRALQDVTKERMAQIPSKIQKGCVMAWAEMVRQMGFKAMMYGEGMVALVLTMLQVACPGSFNHTDGNETTAETRWNEDDTDDSKNEEEQDEEEELEEQDPQDEQDQDLVGIGCKKSPSLRPLLLRTLASTLTQYRDLSLSPQQLQNLWISLGPSLATLPVDITSHGKMPALMTFLTGCAREGRLDILSSHPPALDAIFKCLRVGHAAAWDTVDYLLGENDNIDDDKTISLDSTGRDLLRTHLGTILSSLSNRIVSSTSDIRRSKKKLASREVDLLCRLTALSDNHQPDLSAALAGSLLPSLNISDPPSRTSRTMMILRNLMPTLPPDWYGKQGRLHVLARLLGPAGGNMGRPGLIDAGSRREAALTLQMAARHGNDEKMGFVADSLLLLNASDAKKLGGEHDYEAILPELNSLAVATTWTAATRDISRGWQISCLVPWIYNSLHNLYGEDGVMGRGHVAALKAFVEAAVDADLDAETGDVWIRMVETTLLPHLRNGLRSTGRPAARSHFIAILAHMIRAFRDAPVCRRHQSNQIDQNCGLHLDLARLCNDKEEDLDFWKNIVHIQVHRRGRALSRLRKELYPQDEGECELATRSIIGILLPLAMHPVYECTKSNETPYALEAVATVGAISRHLPFSRWASELQKAIQKIRNYRDQERYIVGMICAMMDGFHFEVVMPRKEKGVVENKKIQQKKESNHDGYDDDDDDKGEGIMEETDKLEDNTTHVEGNTVYRRLHRSLLPAIRSILLKKSSSNGASSKTKSISLRSPVALALLHLYCKLPPDDLRCHLPDLLLTVCNQLRSRESDCRDRARETLAKMAGTLTEEYIGQILDILGHVLSEGYMLHVRSATIHSIMEVLWQRRVDKDLMTWTSRKDPPAFDRAVPNLMNLIIDDLFGTAAEMREAKDANRRVIREAIGTRSYDTLEITSRMILFQHAASTFPKNTSKLSSIEVIVGPLIQKLKQPDVDSATVGKIQECLDKVVIGLSKNVSIQAVNYMHYVHDTIIPFLNVSAMWNISGGSDEGSDSDGGEFTPIQVSHTKKKEKKTKKSYNVKSHVEVWIPSLSEVHDDKSAKEVKKLQKEKQAWVQDGANAPKLTGRSRHGAFSTNEMALDNPSIACGVTFGLSLLHNFLKKDKLDWNDKQTCKIADELVLILTACIENCIQNKIILLSLRCMNFFLRWDLPSIPRCAKLLGQNTLKLLTKSGGMSNTRHEITQSCFKVLTFLMSYDKRKENFLKAQYPKKQATKQWKLQSNSKCKIFFFLTDSQMNVLISLLQISVSDSEHHNTTFGLVKEIVSMRFLSPELYDMMDQILRLTVQSQKDPVRQLSSKIFIQFLLEYPLENNKLQTLLKQIMENVKYEYEDGRCTAIKLVHTLIQRFPSAVLEEYIQLFFLPLVLQLVNDNSKKCRDMLTSAIAAVFKQANVNHISGLYDYLLRWFATDGTNQALALKSASSQLFGVLVESRPEFIKRGSKGSEIVSMLHAVLEAESSFKNMEVSLIGNNRWELVYNCLSSFEKVLLEFPNLAIKNYEFWILVVKFLVYDHPWVQQISSRIISTHLMAINPTTMKLLGGSDKTVMVFISKCRGSLFEIVRNICYQINVDDDQFNEEIATAATKTLTWCIQAMQHYPNLCFSDKNYVAEKEKSPIQWLYNRLSNIAKERGFQRRNTVFKQFAAFATACDSKLVEPYLELIITPIYRSISEYESKKGQQRFHKSPISSFSIDLEKDLLSILENTCGTESYINAYAKVQTLFKKKREKRKSELAVEMVNDPQSASLRKKRKTIKEKKRKKCQR